MGEERGGLIGKSVNEMPYRDSMSKSADDKLTGVPPVFPPPSNTQEESYIERMIRQDTEYNERRYDD